MMSRYVQPSVLTEERVGPLLVLLLVPRRVGGDEDLYQVCTTRQLRGPGRQGAPS